jgi:hypothetical protein
MRTRGVAVVMVFLLAEAGGFADLKAVFAFNGKLIDATMPRLDYRIQTFVDENGRYILIGSPRGMPDGAPGFQIEIHMEKIPEDTASEDYAALAVRKFVREQGFESSELPAGKMDGAGLAGSRDLQVAWTDAQLRAHKGILLGAVSGGVGLLVLLDVLLPDYDAVEELCIMILESVHVEQE